MAIGLVRHKAQTARTVTVDKLCTFLATEAMPAFVHRPGAAHAPRARAAANHSRIGGARCDGRYSMGPDPWTSQHQPHGPGAPATVAELFGGGRSAQSPQRAARDIPAGR